MPTRATLASIAVVLATASPAGAHPGHGAHGEGWSFLHFLTEPDHVAAAALGALLLGVLARWGLGRRANRTAAHE
jgi:hydrogenase/urease accessory protein HupE